jgi:hypothetical protein
MYVERLYTTEQNRTGTVKSIQDKGNGMESSDLYTRRSSNDVNGMCILILFPSNACELRLASKPSFRLAAASRFNSSRSPTPSHSNLTAHQQTMYQI